MIKVLLLEMEYNGLDSKGLKVGILGFLMSMTQMRLERGVPCGMKFFNSFQWTVGGL